MIVGAVAASDTDVARAVLVLLPSRPDLAERVRDGLGARRERAAVVDDALIPESAVAAAVRALQLAGVVAVSSRPLSAESLVQIESFAEGGVVLGEADVLR